MRQYVKPSEVSIRPHIKNIKHNGMLSTGYLEYFIVYCYLYLNQKSDGHTYSNFYVGTLKYNFKLST